MRYVLISKEMDWTLIYHVISSESVLYMAQRELVIQLSFIS